jgi:hypothetical protein
MKSTQKNKDRRTNATEACGNFLTLQTLFRSLLNNVFVKLNKKGRPTSIEIFKPVYRMLQRKFQEVVVQTGLPTIWTRYSWVKVLWNTYLLRLCKTSYPCGT